MPKTKLAITIDRDLLQELDELIQSDKFANRSQAIEAAVADKVTRMKRTRLERELAKLDPDEEVTLAEEGLTADVKEWPDY